MSRFSSTLLGIGWGFALSVFTFICLRDGFDITLNFTDGWLPVTMSVFNWIVPAAVGAGCGLAGLDSWQIILYTFLALLLNIVVFLILILIAFMLEGGFLAILIIMAIIGAPAGVIVVIFGG